MRADERAIPEELQDNVLSLQVVGVDCASAPSIRNRNCRRDWTSHTKWESLSANSRLRGSSIPSASGSACSVVLLHEEEHGQKKKGLDDGAAS
jgi:hypothetical protein